ncbi:hypothetical protein RF11_06292 [Thelohanellus kitauei]|uniref:Uncharacterized protein n=1 Tax=Thelohanellus kitauei TaxID=669202 RepID=A0A0C2MLL5_THEKT|nr:hypothetical protein RF11_06292 [Thelohanellus kitauei]
MKAFVLLFHFLLANAEEKPLLSHLKSLSYQATTAYGVNNMDPELWGSDIAFDKKTSMFGAVILHSVDKRHANVSAAARTREIGTYGGDVFKCLIEDFQNSCASMTVSGTLGMSYARFCKIEII